MNAVKILHCADLHIGAVESSLGVLALRRQAETLITFEKIISLAKENDVDLLLIAGDLFNSNNVDTSIINRCFECFEEISNVKIIFAAGNHDPLNAASPFVTRELPKNVYVLDTTDSVIEFKDINTRVYGKSFKEVYMQGSTNFSLDTDNSFINLMCIHGELRGDLGSDYNSITSEFIKSSGMDYIALGHIHKRSDIGKVGNTFVSYPGCPEGQGFDELGEKGVYMGEISKGVCQLQFVPTAKRMHLAESVNVSGLSTANDIADGVVYELKQKYSATFADNIYKITLVGSINDDTVISVPEISSRLNDILYFAKVLDKTETATDFNALAQEKSLKGIFVKNMLARINNAPDDQKVLLKSALSIGLKAFCGEVNYDET